MSVRFAPAPRVTTYQLHEQERSLKRKGQQQMNREYLRERKLYCLVLQWKRLNQAASQACLLRADLGGFLGEERAAKAAAMGVKDFAGLVAVVAEFVLAAWPRCDITAMRDYELTSTIVLNLVAEFLCRHFAYQLETAAEQETLYSNVFHVAKYVLQCYSSSP